MGWSSTPSPLCLGGLPAIPKSPRVALKPGLGLLPFLRQTAQGPPRGEAPNPNPNPELSAWERSRPARSGAGNLSRSSLHNTQMAHSRQDSSRRVYLQASIYNEVGGSQGPGGLPGLGRAASPALWPPRLEQSASVWGQPARGSPTFPCPLSGEAQAGLGRAQSREADTGQPGRGSPPPPAGTRDRARLRPVPAAFL